MTEDKIFTFTVYADDKTDTVYWDADIRIRKGEEWLKVLRMLKAADTEIMDIIIKNMGIHLDVKNLHRRQEND